MKTLNKPIMIPSLQKITAKTSFSGIVVNFPTALGASDRCRGRGVSREFGTNIPIETFQAVVVAEQTIKFKPISSSVSRAERLDGGLNRAFVSEEIVLTDPTSCIIRDGFRDRFGRQSIPDQIFTFFPFLG